MIVTSALTLAEVLTVKNEQPVGPEMREKVEKFFRSEFIAVENVSRRIAEAAREVVWTHRVKAKDAVHVATALHARVEALHTFDGDLIKRSGLVGVPPLVVCRPVVAQPLLDLRVRPGQRLFG